MIGFKELALLAVVVLVLYGRSGVLKNRQVQAVLPWISPQAASRGGTRRDPRRGARLRPAAISRSLRATGTVGKGAIVYPEGQPALLVLDDSGSNRDRGRDLQPDDDRQRDRAPTLSLTRKGREPFRPGPIFPPASGK